MSTQMTSDAINSIEPPTIAPKREITSAMDCKRPIRPFNARLVAASLPAKAWRAAQKRYCVGAFSPRALPTVAFHSLAHSAPQRLAQLASTTPSTSFLCVSASSGFTATMVDLASLPIVQGCVPVLQLAASLVVVLIVAHILSS